MSVVCGDVCDECCVWRMCVMSVGVEDVCDECCVWGCV